MLKMFTLGYVIDIVSSAVLWLPVFIALDILFRRKMRIRWKLSYLTLAVYLSAVFSIVGLPGITTVTLDLTFNWIPFADILYYTERYIEISILNILLFLPLGVLLPLMWEEFQSLKRTALFGFGLSLLIETLQIFTFRVSDVDDLITNTLGTIAGYVLVSVLTKKFRYNILDTGNGCAKKELSILLSVVLLSVFFVQPYISDAVWGLLP